MEQAEEENGYQNFASTPHVREIPTRSLTFSEPYENAIAFGGVATGSEKANEHEMVAGTAMYKGCKPACDAKRHSTGKNMLAVLTLLVNSEKKNCIR